MKIPIDYEQFSKDVHDKIGETIEKGSLPLAVVMNHEAVRDFLLSEIVHDYIKCAPATITTTDTVAMALGVSEVFISTKMSSTEWNLVAIV